MDLQRRRMLLTNYQSWKINFRNLTIENTYFSHLKKFFISTKRAGDRKTNEKVSPIYRHRRRTHFIVCLATESWLLTFIASDTFLLCRNDTFANAAVDRPNKSLLNPLLLSVLQSKTHVFYALEAARFLMAIEKCVRAGAGRKCARWQSIEGTFDAWAGTKRSTR